MLVEIPAIATGDSGCLLAILRDERVLLTLGSWAHLTHSLQMLLLNVILIVVLIMQRLGLVRKSIVDHFNWHTIDLGRSILPVRCSSLNLSSSFDFALLLLMKDNHTITIAPLLHGLTLFLRHVDILDVACLIVHAVRSAAVVDL